MTVYWGSYRGYCIVWLLALIAVVGTGYVRPAAAQQPGPTTTASIAERLNAVQADLYSRDPHLKRDIKTLNSILATDPHIAEVHMLLGVAYRGLAARGLDMIAEAKAELRQAVALNPELLMARLLLAQVHLDLGQPKRARHELLAALKQAPGQPQLLAVLSDAERKAGDPTAALRASQQALEADPRFVEARYYRALALLDLDRRDEAIQQLEQVVATNPHEPNVYLTLGTVYLDAGRSADAVRMLQQGAQIGPSYTDLRVALSRAYRAEGALADAQAQLTAADSVIDAQAAATTVYQQMCARIRLEWGLLRLDQGRLDEAATALAEAIDMAPDHGAAHRALAEVRLRQGLYAQAREEADLAAQHGSPISDALRQRLDAHAPGAAKGAATR